MLLAAGFSEFWQRQTQPNGFFLELQKWRKLIDSNIFCLHKIASASVQDFYIPTSRAAGTGVAAHSSSS